MGDQITHSIIHNKVYQTTMTRLVAKDWHPSIRAVFDGVLIKIHFYLKHCQLNICRNLSHMWYWCDGCWTGMSGHGQSLSHQLLHLLLLWPSIEGQSILQCAWESVLWRRLLGQYFIYILIFDWMLFLLDPWHGGASIYWDFSHKCCVLSVILTDNKSSKS